MKQEPRPYRYKLSLRLDHPSTQLDSCEERFALATIRMWSAGDPRTSPRGAPLPGTRENSYWVGAFEPADGEEVEEALERVAASLAEHATFLTQHLGSGGSAEVFIGFFLEGFNSGFVLPPALLARFGTLGVALDFDIYGPSDSPHAP